MLKEDSVLRSERDKRIVWYKFKTYLLIYFSNIKGLTLDSLNNLLTHSLAIFSPF
jgi:hypothetical protein